jgi:hypothetical protein
LRDFKEAQKVAYADLPHPDPWEEEGAPWSECKSLRDVVPIAQSGNARLPPHVTLLRCALADLAAENKPSAADDIFRTIFSTELPSVLNIDDAYQVCANANPFKLTGMLNGWTSGLTSSALNVMVAAGIVVENAQ